MYERIFKAGSRTTLYKIFIYLFPYNLIVRSIENPLVVIGFSCIYLSYMIMTHKRLTNWLLKKFYRDVYEILGKTKSKKQL